MTACVRSLWLSLALFAATCFFSVSTFAACTVPNGNEGDLNYSAVQHVLAYCNGTNWVAMGSSSAINFGTLTTNDFCTATSGTAITCTTAQIGLTSQVIGVLPMANGGTNANSASGTALDNITGFSSTGFLTRTGAGAYSFVSTTNGITLGNIATIGANTVLGNNAGSAATIAALSMPSCSGATSALTWTTSTGFGCNTISAGGSGTVTSSNAGQVAYYQSSGTTVIGTSTMNIVGGNVGIGTMSPLSSFDTWSSTLKTSFSNQSVIGSFEGGAAEGDGTSRARLIVEGSTNTTNAEIDLRSNDYLSSTLRGAHLGYVPPGGAMGADGDFIINVYPTGGTALTIDATNGHVGIGTTSPSYPLSIFTTNGVTAQFISSNSARAWFDVLNSSGSNYSGAIDLGDTSGHSWEIGTDLSQNKTQTFYIYDGVAAATRFYINSSGNVGINTTSPATTLEVNGDTQIDGRISQTGPGRTTTVSTSNYDARIGSNDLYFYFKSISGGAATAGVLQFMRISDGATSWPLLLNPNGAYVGINTYSPGSPLDVAGNVHSSTGFYSPNLAWGISGLYSVQWPYETISNNSNLRLATTGGVYFHTGSNAGSSSASAYIDTSGNAVFNGNVYSAGFYQNSDRRLKENIKPIAGLDIIEKLNGVTFNWKKDGKPSAGVIAQEVEKVMPEAVSVSDQTGMQSVSYDSLIAPLIEGEKELKAANDDLRHKVSSQAEDIRLLKEQLQSLKRASPP